MTRSRLAARSADGLGDDADDDADGVDDDLDDRLENLELSGLAVNPPGVVKFYDRWRAFAIPEPGIRRLLGVFDTVEEATEAQEAWRNGKFAPGSRGRPRKPYSVHVCRFYSRWQVYEREDGRQRRLRIVDTREEAEVVAAEARAMRKVQDLI